MGSSRRQRLVDSLWPKLEQELDQPEGERSLAKALIASAAMAGTGRTTTFRKEGTLHGIDRGDDLVVEHSDTLSIEDLQQATAGVPVAVSRIRKLVSEFTQLERSAFSQLISFSTDRTASALVGFPLGLVEAVIGARSAMRDWPGSIDLLLQADNYALLATYPGIEAGTLRALRGGAVLQSSKAADGFLVPHLPGPLVLDAVEAKRLDWDTGDSDTVVFTVSERLRFWRTEPKPRVVDLELSRSPRR